VEEDPVGDRVDRHVDDDAVNDSNAVRLNFLQRLRIGEPATARLLHPVFQLLPIASEHVKDNIATVVGFAAVTFISVIFGELLPKWTAIQFAEKSAQAVAMPMLIFIRLFYPLIWALEASASMFAKWMGLNPGAVGSHDTAHSEDEIMAIVEVEKLLARWRQSGNQAPFS